MIGHQLHQPSQAETILVPCEPLKAVFASEVVRRFLTAPKPSQALQHRVAVLTACGPYPSDEQEAYRVKCLRSIRAAWEVYLEAAFSCGMFEGKRGTDLRERLVGIEDEGFRSAFAECMTCWFLAGRMRLDVGGLAKGRDARMLDMNAELPEGRVGIEVKAPSRELPTGTTTWCGDDSDKIRQCLEAAERQFAKDGPNILVIAPSLRTTMFTDRNVLVRAVYGESVLVFDVNTEQGGLVNQRLEFSPRGKFLNTQQPGGKRLKPDGFPAYRRVSAVLCIEERVRERYPFPADEFLACRIPDCDRGEMFRRAKRKLALHYSDANEVWIDHNILLLHNPYAYYSISESLWIDFPQLVPREDHMEWTDGFSRPV